MAAADYIRCAVCDRKVAYDGHWTVRDAACDSGGDIEAICADCNKTHVLRAVPRADTPNALPDNSEGP